jgi:hypothetical protein
LCGGNFDGKKQSDEEAKKTQSKGLVAKRFFVAKSEFNIRV